MDEWKRKLLNRLQHGLPLTADPWGTLAEELQSSSEALRMQVARWLDDGTLTRFGPLFDIEQVGGAFSLCALSVPEDRFDKVAALLAAMPEVAHNYRREHRWNMWFVLACAHPEEISDSIRTIEEITGLSVLNLPKERTYHVGLHFPV